MIVGRSWWECRKVSLKGPGGSKSYDRVLLFKMILQHLHNRSEEQAKYHVQERLGFQRFFGQGLKEAVPDRGETRAAVLWYLFRDDWKGHAL